MSAPGQSRETAASVTAPLAPASVGERIEVLDVLRGFALLGILLVNMQFFAFPMYAVLTGAVEHPTWVDQAAALLVAFLAEGKFYPIFSFLFGLGFAILALRADAAGRRLFPLYGRRLLVLLAIGLAHALLLWYGDILVTYALLGFLLLLFRNRSPRTLLAWAALSLSVPVLIFAGLVGMVALAQLVPEAAADVERQFAENEAALRAMSEQAMHAYSQGSSAEIMAQRAQDLAFTYSVAFVIVPPIFAMFLIGLYAGRRGVFQDIGAHLPFLRRVLVWGLALGLVGNLLFTATTATGNRMEPSGPLLLGTLGQAVGGPALALAYVAGITLLMQSAVWRRRLGLLAVPGRMALTNYLLQSVVCTTIFYSYGLGLFGQLGMAELVGLALAIFLLQIPLSYWWMGRFQFGPAEWLWRSLTYGARQPLRRSSA